MEIALKILAGLALFLYGVGAMSDTLKELLHNRASGLLERYTRNLLTGILAGTVITVILDSSSAVIILTIVLVNAGALSFRASMGVVMGANIGTTFSSQIISLDVGEYSAVPLIIGLALVMAGKRPAVVGTGKLLVNFGMLFFGLFTMESAMEPLRDDPEVVAWLQGLENPLRGAMMGALLTLVIQSSSATVGMVITLAKESLISLPAGVAVMLGAELGTCSDTLLATLRSNRQALKTGLFHLFFNLVSIILGLMLLKPFLSLVLALSRTSEVEGQVANAHMLFNTLGVLLFFFFVPWIEKALNRLLPERAPQPLELENDMAS